MSNTNDTVATATTDNAVDNTSSTDTPLLLTQDMVVPEGAVIMDGPTRDYDPMLANPDAYFGELTEYKPTLLDRFYGAYYTAVEAVREAVRKVHRSLPRLIWYGQEVDVLITFTKEKFSDNPFALGNVSPDVQAQYKPDEVGEATMALAKGGVGFDTFYTSRGRTWCFDYSLSGPVRVKFIGKAKAPLKRKA